MRLSTRTEGDGTLVLQYKGDAQALVDHCAQAAREDRERRDLKMHDRRRLLSLPREVLYKIALDLGIPLSRIGDHMDAIWKVAMGRDYSRFRTLDTGRAYRQTRRSSVVAIRR